MSEQYAVPAEADRPCLVGLRPWLPWPLSRWRWWTRPVRAERLAVLRIAVAALMLLDVLGSYLPAAADFFGADSMGRPDLYEWRFSPKYHFSRWSLLHNVESHGLIRAALLVWAGASFCLMIGAASRLSAVVAWALSLSVANVNDNIDNAGDLIRTIVLFYFMLCPCGAAWSVDSWLRRRFRLVVGHGSRRNPWELAVRVRRRAEPFRGPAYVYPWALRLLFVQMAMIYFANGLYKLAGPEWRAGRSLYYVLGDVTLARWSYAQFPIPARVTQWMTWSVLAWEVTFPLMMCVPWRSLGLPFAWLAGWLARRPGLLPRLLAPVVWLPSVLRWGREVVLLFGVAFHLGIGISMELGGFAFYMLCLYLPLLPWDRWLAPPRAAPAAPAAGQAPRPEEAQVIGVSEGASAAR
jgi:hypothetical protein